MEWPQQPADSLSVRAGSRRAFPPFKAQQGRYKRVTKMRKVRRDPARVTISSGLQHESGNESLPALRQWKPDLAIPALASSCDDYHVTERAITRRMAARVAASIATRNVRRGPRSNFRRHWYSRISPSRSIFRSPRRGVQRLSFRRPPSPPGVQVSRVRPNDIEA